MHFLTILHGHQGLTFFCNLRASGSVSPDDVHQLPSDDLEVKRTAGVNAVQAGEEVDAVTCMIHYFDSWTQKKKKKKVCGLDLEI